MQYLNNLATQKTEQFVDVIQEVIASERYGVEYQPIVETSSGEIVAYEALARFYSADGSSLSPLNVFDQLHRNSALLRQVERELKALQLSHAPADTLLFVNIDPHSIDPVELAKEPLLSILGQQDKLVVELIENSDIHEAENALLLQAELSKRGIATALDDIGAAHALLSLPVLAAVDYMKFDRSWTNKLRDVNDSYMLAAMLDYATNTGKQTILEGIENEAMLETARHFNISYVQGFHYKPEFLSVFP